MRGVLRGGEAFLLLFPRRGAWFLEATRTWYFWFAVSTQVSAGQQGSVLMSGQAVHVECSCSGRGAGREGGERRWHRLDCISLHSLMPDCRSGMRVVAHPCRGLLSLAWRVGGPMESQPLMVLLPEP